MTLATGNPPSTAPTAAGAGTVAQASGPPAARRPRTDRRLRRTRAALAVGSLVFGAAGITSAQFRMDSADDVKSHSGVMIQQAEVLYHKLSEADATSATIYLHVGEAPKALLTQYDQDLKDAQAALLTATDEAGDDATARAALKEISQQLPIYAKLNATAAANNLVGYPVGFRYLTQASNLMQETILPQAQKLSDTEAKNLADAEQSSKQLPWMMLVAGLLLMAALIVVQVRESRRTNRVFSLGLVGASTALVLSAVWMTAAGGIQDDHVDRAKRHGSDQIAALSTARILSLQARTDEMLTLVGRGTADDRERDFTGTTDANGTHTPGTMDKLGQALHTATDTAPDDEARKLNAQASSDVGVWTAQHTQLRDFDRQNQYQKAVNSALGEGADFTAPKASAAQAFATLQADLDKAIGRAEDTFRSEAKTAADTLTGLQIGLGVLSVAMAAAVVMGLGRRLAEYH